MTFRHAAVGLLPLLLLATSPAAATRVWRDATDVGHVLEAQAEAWNRGDLRGYMAGYAQYDDTTFVSGDSVTRGWQTVFDRYAKKYDTPAKMGKLTFSDLGFRQFGPDDMVVTGAWELVRQSDKPHGRFTLLFHRFSVGWRIVYDHSS